MPSILEQINTLNSIKKDIEKSCKNNSGSSYNFNGWSECLNKIKDTTTNKNSDKHGIRIDIFLPQLDEHNNNSYVKSQEDIVLGTNILSIGEEALRNVCCNNKRIKSFSCPSVKSIKNNGALNAFANCANLASVDLSSLVTIETSGLSLAFLSCESLVSIDLSSLTTVGDHGLSNAFANCTNLTSVDLSSLQSVAQYSLSGAFANCTKLTNISFPSLTNVQTKSFSFDVFRNCTNLTEIHFRYDMKSTIEALEEYSNNFGAENATIYFDLARAELEVTPTPADATVTFYDENGAEIPNPTATEINKYAWSVEENGEHFITVEFHDGSSYVYYRDTINDSSQNTALSNPTYYSAWTTKDTNAPYVTVWTLCDETFSSEILDNNYVVSYKPTGGNTASSSSKPVTPVIPPTSIPETKITNTGQDTKITTYYTDNENATQGDIVYDINGNQTQYSVESCKNDKILLRRPVFIYNVDVTPSDATVTFTQNSEELDKLSTGEVVEYYAWTTNGITYYTKTDTPVVGEAVYDSNKELVPNKTIIAVDENTGTITIG